MSQLNQQSTKGGKDQKSIQSGTTPDPEYQWESDNNTIHFEFKAVLGSKFQYPSNFKSTLQANSSEHDQTPRFAASDLVLAVYQCPTKSLIWVKVTVGRILDLLPFW